MLRAVAILAMLWGATSCISPTGAAMVDVPPYGWHRAAEIAVDNADTLTERDLYLLLRYNARFRADTLSLRMTIVTPDSLYATERVLFAPWAQRGAAPARQVVRLPFRDKVVFDRRGLYRIIITPLAPVEGVEAAGIDIVKNES